jgi:hypothetical protein
MRPLAVRLAILHRALVWVASAVLACWMLSGFLHPLMSLIAAKPQRFAPPALQLDAAALPTGWEALRAAQGDAAIIRAVPGPQGPLWQLTDGFNSERRYLHVDGSTFDGGEAAYARWLAGWYLGEDAPIASLTLQTEFDDAYPWVNRLLPVWRVEIGGAHPRTAWLHTETGALASFGDARRTQLQAVFRALHTLSWLDGLEPLRVALVASAMLCLIALAGSGLYLFWRRPGARGARRWHRRLGIAVALPLLLMASSGLLHALVSAGAPPPRGLAPPPPLSALPATPDWTSLVGAQQQLALRDVDGRVVVVHRPVDAPTLAIKSLDGLASPSIDDLVQHTAALHGIDGAFEIEPVPHFSPDYDFRNRRLPAWIAVDGSGERIALDPLTGQRIDRQSAIRRGESWVFAIVHKWQPLAHALGNPSLRDALQVGWLALIVPLGVLGWRLRRRAR